MFTRKQYINKECTNEQYYGQFVMPATRAWVLSGIGLAELKKSNDPYFNDIPLHKWDGLVANCPGSAAFSKAGDYYTLAGGICLLKEAARQVLEQ